VGQILHRAEVGLPGEPMPPTPGFGLVEEACDICGAVASMRLHLDVSLVGDLPVKIYRCERCGFRQIRPRITQEELERLYPEAYFDSRSGIGFDDYAVQQQRIEREAFFLVKRLERIGRTGRLLEVGCALGFLLEAVRRFSAWEVVGLDISPLAVEFARRQYGLPVERKTLEAARFPDASFDFIVQKDLLEHVIRPRDHLRETFRILKPGGQVWLVTPNGEANLRPFHALIARHRGSGNPMLPLLDQGHLQFFTRENLLRLFEDCGFQCVWLRAVGIRRGLRALGYLPRKWSAVRLVPSGPPREGRSAVPATLSASANAAELARLCDQLAAEIRARHTKLRSWPPYFYYRRVLRGFDGLPGRLGVGYDFGCLLRKPR